VVGRGLAACEGHSMWKGLCEQICYWRVCLLWWVWSVRCSVGGALVPCAVASHHRPWREASLTSCLLHMSAAAMLDAERVGCRRCV
jgi:hypothetical protein